MFNNHEAEKRFKLSTQSSSHLSVSVLAGFRSGHFHDFAGMSLQQHVAVLAQSRALHREGGRGTRLTGLEIKIRVCHGALSQGRCGGKHPSCDSSIFSYQKPDHTSHLKARRCYKQDK